MRNFILFAVLVVGSLLWSKDFVASGKFQNFIDKHPHPVWSARSQYALGHIYKMKSNYVEAEKCFARFSEVYPEHPLALDAFYHEAECTENLDHLASVPKYTNFLKKYPRSPYTKIVQKKLEYLQN